jgi:hypothetical protein
LQRAATSAASSDFPIAVGPTMKKTGFKVPEDQEKEG